MVFDCPWSCSISIWFGPCFQSLLFLSSRAPYCHYSSFACRIQRFAARISRPACSLILETFGLA